jgi:hypothetical protein
MNRFVYPGTVRMRKINNSKDGESKNEMCKYISFSKNAKMI